VNVSSNNELLDGVLHGLDLCRELPTLVGQNTSSDD
jgi:hypothetical protein